MARRPLNEVEVRDHGVLSMQPIDGLLKGLAELDATPHQVVSMYLDARWRDEQQRERARLTLKEAHAEAKARLKELPEEVAAPAARDLARADEYAQLVIKQRIDVGFEGIAAFFCEPRGIELVTLTHAEMPTSLRIETRPHLLPLARSANDHDVALVAVVETDETRIYELAMGGLAATAHLQGDVPDRVQRGGWRQLRIQKHIADHILHHHKEAARDLLARFDGISGIRGRPPRVVLGGREEMLAAFERNLPERVLARAVRVTDIDPQGPDDVILGKVRAALAQAVARHEREIVRAVEDSAAMGRGVLGVDAVLRVINEGRVWELLLDPRFDRQGTRCVRCDLLGSERRDRCPACGGALETVHLRDELVRRAVLASAEIHEFVDRELAEHGGVAAILRY